MKSLLRVIFTVALMALIWRSVDGAAALSLLGGAEPGLLLLALALLSAQIFLSALRWSMTARALGQNLPFPTAVSEYHLGMLLNFTMPGGVVGDVGRALRTRAACGIAASARSVMIERLSGQVIVVLVLVPGLALWPPTAPWGASAAAVAVAAVCAAALLATVPGPLRRFGQALRRAWTPWPRALSQGAVSMACLGCMIGAMAACSAAVGAPLGPAALVVAPLTLVAMLAPVSIGGWGLREGAAVAVWPLAGHSAQAGLAASIAFGVLALAASLPGVVVAARAHAARADAAPRPQAAPSARIGSARPSGPWP